MKKVFIICPVRNIAPEVLRRIKLHVCQLEKRGRRVHWPFRDTDQNDPVGLRICADNREALLAADEVHIWYDPGSAGSLFDAGMLFAFLRDHPKKVMLMNEHDVRPTVQKSFANVLLALAQK